MAKEDPIERIEREQANQAPKLKKIIIALAVILGIIAIQDALMCGRLSTDKKDLTERIISLQGEYNALSSDYDAINSQLDSSREEVAQLLDHIKKTNAANTSKMRQYEKELGTLRSIMRGYIAQIDSLNSQNQKLAADLAASRTEAAESKALNEELTAQVVDLTGKVKTGSIIKARAINVVGYNASDKTTDRSSRVVKLQVNLTLVENALTEKGPKMVYVKVEDPEGQLITDGTNAALRVNGETIAASACREVDYEGAEVDMSIYVNNVPSYTKGVYTATVFTEESELGKAELMLR